MRTLRRRWDRIVGDAERAVLKATFRAIQSPQMRRLAGLYLLCVCLFLVVPIMLIEAVTGRR